MLEFRLTGEIADVIDSFCTIAKLNRFEFDEGFTELNQDEFCYDYDFYKHGEGVAKFFLRVYLNDDSVKEIGLHVYSGGGQFVEFLKSEDNKEVLKQALEYINEGD